MKLSKICISMILAVIMLVSSVISVSALEYEYPEKDMWYQTTKNVQILRDPPIWDNVSQLFEDELYINWPVAGFSMEDYVNSPAGEGLIKLLEPIVLFEDEMGADLLAYWEEKGIRKVMYNADDPANKYAAYVPVNMEAGKTYPLMVLQSGGSDPIFTAEGFGVVAYGAEKGYITVIPQNRDSATTIAMIDAMIKEYPVDTTRVYMTGNGGGMLDSCRTLITYPEYFAAASPFGCEFILRQRNGEYLRYFTDEEMEKNFLGSGIQLPIQLLDGTMAKTTWHPINQRPDIDYRIGDYNLWFRINGIKAPEISRESVFAQIIHAEAGASAHSGLEFTKTWTVPMEKDYHFGELYDAAGVPMYRFVSVEDSSHWHSASYPQVIWDYCSMFSRDAETGKIIYKPAE